MVNFVRADRLRAMKMEHVNAMNPAVLYNQTMEAINGGKTVFVHPITNQEMRIDI